MNHQLKEERVGGDRLIGVRSTDRQEEVKRDRQTDRRGEKPKETLEDMAWVNKVGVGDISICLWVWTRQGDRVLQWAAVGWKTTDRMSHSGTTWRSPSSSLASACLVCLSVCLSVFGHVTQSEKQTGSVFTEEPILICLSSAIFSPHCPHRNLQVA